MHVAGDMYLNAGETMHVLAIVGTNSGPSCGGGFGNELDIEKATLSAQWLNNLSVAP